jgi:hypothetical protein
MNKNLPVIREQEKPHKTGIMSALIDRLPSSIKSFLFGGGQEYVPDQQTYVDASGQINWQLLISSHVFGRKALKQLVDMGYTHSPAGYGIMNKILLAQRNIVFTPYWKGKPYKAKTLTLDLNYALRMLLSTGTCLVYKKEIVGFAPELTILNTLDIEETYQAGRYSYRLFLDNGTWVNLDSDSLIFIVMPDIVRRETQMGLPPYQSALMPLESLKEMYVADTSTLKNKGSDVLITNDSDMPMVEDDKKTAQDTLNERIGGARRSGTVAVSTAKLRVLNLGKTAKELALWDGYKIKIRDLCNVLQVDSGQFNDPDNKKYANAIEGKRALYTECVIPFTQLITENKKLKEALGYDIFLDVSNIDCLQTAQSERAVKSKTVTDAIVNLNAQVKGGTISPDIAVKILVSEWGFDQEEAIAYIQIPTEPPTAPAPGPTE